MKNLTAIKVNYKIIVLKNVIGIKTKVKRGDMIMYDDIKLGLFDSLRVKRIERRTNSLIKKMENNSNKDFFIDLSQAEELKEELLKKKQIRVATRDARKKYRELYGKKYENISLDDFIKSYLEKNNLIIQALPEPESGEILLDEEKSSDNFSEPENEKPLTKQLESPENETESIIIKETKQPEKIPTTEIKYPKTEPPLQDEFERVLDITPTQNENEQASTTNIDLISKKEILKGMYSIRTRNNNIGIEHYNARNGLAKGYDTTRLLLGNEIKLDEHTLRHIKVSWYNSKDYLNKQKEDDNADYNKYISLLAEIDVTLLVTNQEYSNKVMKELLDKNRVISFINRESQEKSNMENGRYIGGVKAVKDESPKIFFNANVGGESNGLNKVITQIDVKENDQENPIIAKRKEIEETEKRLEQLKKELDILLKNQNKTKETMIEQENYEK